MNKLFAINFFHTRAALLVAGGFLFGNVICCSARTYHISVPATAAWFDTGIRVPPGATVEIKASGRVVYGELPQQVTGPGGTNYDGQQYFSTSVLPDATIVSLIGKVGGTSEVGTGTPLPEGLAGNGEGYVGKSYRRVVTSGGELFLGFNDQVSAFDDNAGSFRVTITIQHGRFR